MDPATISMIMGATQNSPLMKRLMTPPEAFKSGAGYQGGNPNPFAMMARPGSLMNMMPISYGQNPSFASGGAMPNAAAPITIPLLNERLTGIRDLGPANPDGMAMSGASYQRTGGEAANKQPAKAVLAAPRGEDLQAMLGGMQPEDPAERLARETKLQEMQDQAALERQQQSDQSALNRQLISSGANFLGGLMRAPAPVTVGGFRQNPNLSMYRRRRGLMGG